MRREFIPLLSAFVLVYAWSEASAQSPPGSSSPVALPAPDNDEGWTQFCAGLYIELIRQASAGNDRIRFDDSTRRIGNLTTELLYRTATGSWSVSRALDLTWAQNGRRIAGAEIWDLPLTPGETPTWRDMARQIRRAPERICDDRSDKAARYLGLARRLMTPK